MAQTYTSATPIEGRRFTCKRCKRVYAYPEPGDHAIRCECGWRYENVGGRIVDEFKPRLDGKASA